MNIGLKALCSFVCTERHRTSANSASGDGCRRYLGIVAQVSQVPRSGSRKVLRH